MAFWPTGRTIRLLGVAESWSPRSPILEVSSSTSGQAVAAVLDRAIGTGPGPVATPDRSHGVHVAGAARLGRSAWREGWSYPAERSHGQERDWMV